MIMELGSPRVWPVVMGCLLLLGTWSNLRYVRGSVLAHLFIWLVFPTCVSRLITLWYLSHYTVLLITNYTNWNIPRTHFHNDVWRVGDGHHRVLCNTMKKWGREIGLAVIAVIFLCNWKSNTHSWQLNLSYNALTKHDTERVLKTPFSCVQRCFLLKLQNCAFHSENKDFFPQKICNILPRLQ
jgi:hypothetical protein